MINQWNSGTSDNLVQGFHSHCHEQRKLRQADISDAWLRSESVFGRDGALRRPRRVARRNSPRDFGCSFRPLCAGGDIAARCPYQIQEWCHHAPRHVRCLLRCGKLWLNVAP